MELMSKLSFISSPNIDGFYRFFHCLTQQIICNDDFWHISPHRRNILSHIPIQSCSQFYESGSDEPLRRYRRYFLAHAHLCHISTYGGSSSDGFRIIAHPISYLSLITTMALSGLVFEIWAWGRQTTPLLKPFKAYCCHMGTSIKHPVPDRVKPSFVIFDIRALWRSGLSVRVPGCQKLQMTA